MFPVQREVVILDEDGYYNDRFGKHDRMLPKRMSAMDALYGCPPGDFVRLVFGFRTLEELADAWPDIVVKRECRYLLGILFPVMTYYINAPFSYRGAL